jgi:hypothetical protein
MKRIATVLLFLAVLGVAATPQIQAQTMTKQQYARKSRKEIKHQQKTLKRQNKQARKAMKKAQKAQLKANRKANRHKK